MEAVPERFRFSINIKRTIATARMRHGCLLHSTEFRFVCPFSFLLYPFFPTVVRVIFVVLLHLVLRNSSLWFGVIGHYWY
jgi:hypothetical protein